MCYKWKAKYGGMDVSEVRRLKAHKDETTTAHPVADTEGMERLAPGGDASWDRLLDGVPLGRAASRDEIADLALFQVSGAARYIHGTVLAIDGGQINTGSQGFGAMLLASLAAKTASA